MLNFEKIGLTYEMSLEEKLKIYNQTKLEAKSSFIRIGPFG